jgi:hypothetical protein
MRRRRPLLLLLTREMLLRGRNRVLPYQMRLPVTVCLRLLLLRYLGLRGQHRRVRCIVLLQLLLLGIRRLLRRRRTQWRRPRAQRRRLDRVSVLLCLGLLLLLLLHDMLMLDLHLLELLVLALAALIPALLRGDRRRTRGWVGVVRRLLDVARTHILRLGRLLLLLLLLGGVAVLLLIRVPLRCVRIIASPVGGIRIRLLLL